MLQIYCSYEAKIIYNKLILLILSILSNYSHRLAHTNRRLFAGAAEEGKVCQQVHLKH